MEQRTATENVPQQGVYQAPVPIRTFEAGASFNAVSLSGQVNIHNSTVHIGTHCENQRNCSCSVEPSTSVDIDTLQFTELKEYYKTTLCKASPLPWYPEYTWDIDEVYTELALQKSAISKFGVEELFKRAHEHFRKGGYSYRILIEGDAGYGKSTFMLKIASDWSKRDSNDHTKYTSPFSLLFVVKLGFVGKNGKILSYMESIYNDKMDLKLKNVLKSKGAEEVLILLDGYDEANAKTKKEVDRIMVKEMMSKCHVVLTSRFGHVPNHVKCKVLLVTVNGFGPSQVTEAVGKFFTKAGHVTKADVISCTVELVPLRESGSDNELDDTIRPSIDDFKNDQEIYPLLPVAQRLSLEQFKQFMRKVQAESPCKELAQCPLLCVMMCCLVSECPNGDLPSTCSGLYFAMINRNLYRSAQKKAKATGSEGVKWNWNVLDSRIRQGHESYLQKFGRFCIDSMKTKSTSFTLFDITGNEEEARTTDVTPLIEAGVLVQDTELNTKENTPRYQVPHRTTAEFLAAYYLSRETDQNKLQQNFLDLFRLRANFDEVAVSLIEMGKSRCLVDAFRVIKFRKTCLTTFIKRYFTQHGAAGTWSEFKDALPNKLIIRLKDLSPGSQQTAYEGNVTVGSSESSLPLLQLVEQFGKENIGETNALRSFPKDCLVSLHVKKGFKARSLPSLLQTLLKSGAVLNSLEFGNEDPEYEVSDQMRQKLVHSLQELLKSDSCPVQLSFSRGTKNLILAVTESMQEVPEACRLKSFQFLQKWNYGVDGDITQLSKVLAEKWLSHLQHLVLGYKDNVHVFRTIDKPGFPRDWNSGVTLNPLLKRLTEPGCSLTSLYLCDIFFTDKKGKMHLETLMMLASKLETLKLEDMNLYFKVNKTSTYTVKEKCSLKRLHLKNISLELDGLLPTTDENKELILALRNVALNLEALTIDYCTFPIELFSWLNLTVPNLRTVAIGRIHRKMPNNGKEFYANQLLEALTRSSGDSIEDLSFEVFFWDNGDVVMLHPIREALQLCPRVKRVKLGILWVPARSKDSSIGPDPSAPLSSSDMEALKSNNVYLALLKIVLNMPKLQTLSSRTFFKYWEEIGTYHAIADMAEKWPGKRNDNECNTSLTLHGLSKKDVCSAMHVFRERELEYCLRHVRDKVYELWFPV